MALIKNLFLPFCKALAENQSLKSLSFRLELEEDEDIQEIVNMGKSNEIQEIFSNNYSIIAGNIKFKDDELIDNIDDELILQDINFITEMEKEINNIIARNKFLLKQNMLRYMLWM